MAIKYVCLSDLHLGEEDSLLTGINDEGKAAPDKVSPVLSALVECLREVLKDQDEKPILILCGDVMEMAMAGISIAGKAFLTFIRETMPDGNRLFSDMYYLPGNHDHHLWDLARENQYVEHLGRKNSVEEIDPPWHTTKIFQGQGEDVLTSYFIDGLLKVQAQADGFNNLEDLKIKIRYPNLAVESADGNRVAVFGHGHYVESLYRGVSKVKTAFFPDTKEPADFLKLESENFAWLDFFWSALSRSGEAGDKSEDIWEGLRYEKKMDLLTDNLSAGVAGWINIPLMWEGLEKATIKVVVKLAKSMAGTERKKADDVLCEDAVAGLKSYLNMLYEKHPAEENPPSPDKDVTFVFGHTHKPFVNPGSKYGLKSRVKTVFNTGGWVLDDPYQALTKHGGAVVFLDEALKGAALEMYREKDNYEGYKVNLLEPEGNEASDLVGFLQEKLAGKPELWSDFSKTTQNEMKKRAGFLKQRIEADLPKTPGPRRVSPTYVDGP